MKQKSGPDKAPAEQVLKNIRRQTRRQYSAEENIRIVLERLGGEESISELCTPPRCITAGPRSFLRPASAGWRVVPESRSALRSLTGSRPCYV